MSLTFRQKHIERAQRVIDSLPEIIAAVFAEADRGTGSISTRHIVTRVTERLQKKLPDYTREQILEAWCCSLIEDRLVMSGAKKRSDLS